MKNKILTKIKNITSKNNKISEDVNGINYIIDSSVQHNIGENTDDTITKREIGNFFEEYTIHHMIEEGYDILEHSYKTKKLEIDIIAKKDKKLVFVEVKSRNVKHKNNPLDAVDNEKMLNIFYAAKNYVKYLESKTIDTSKISVHFDAAGITYDDDYNVIDFVYCEDFYISEFI